MSHAQSTINPARANFFRDLKGDLGHEVLETLDPEKAKSQSLPTAAGSSTTKLERYPCITQKPTPAAIAGSISATALQVGLGKEIPRWKTGPTKTVNFAVLANGYPKPDLAFLAANKLHEAANEWNELKLGVQFEWVSKIEDAAFVLTYAKEVSPGTLAEAFFPNNVDLNVLNVYPAAFQEGTVQYLKNIFLHELGHILGLRHEFAPERETDANLNSVQIGPRNPTSVMAYEFPPLMQPSDIDSTKTFYQFSGTHLGVMEKTGRLPIVDYDANN
ncbi:hypothetical protein N7532_000926 [Penicillium argentinense]|uniref:Peptidase metallopeptidase domain-containing protein n=1 Tax=Penicillium argentinense TaxID=1131581 RepID=A0A9W9G1Q2_9EURO|nr:uncharacterized protein N7532_000926 [Penicillium argentinense]KAJ5110391.1 hypothetical protein N7532_000926 [Penicillium argentinense]